MREARDKGDYRCCACDLEDRDPGNMKKSPHLRLFGLSLTLGLVLVIFTDTLFLLFGGEYLAERITPKLPPNSAVSECFSQHTVLCKNIDYTTSYSPKDIVGKWSTPIDEYENLDGKISFSSEKCNESWLGMHYASFHKRREPVCGTMTAWSDNSSNITYVFLQLRWSVCPEIVYRYFLHAQYFRCFEG